VGIYPSSYFYILILFSFEETPLLKVLENNNGKQKDGKQACSLSKT